ncbi:MAG: ParB N-terminal domain-containing protein, partial [Anaerolineae bacterium]|nr:ParB N-terminal domain-containing protein [Anaerolineae bacterium]
LAPTKWVDSIADPDNVQLAKQDLRGETFVREFDPETGAAIPPVEEAYADLANDIAEHGIQNPLIVAIDADGVPFLLDGHHRLEAAKQIGLEEVPVQFRREGVLEPAPGLSQNNVTRQLKPDWYGPKTDLYQEITNDPEAFVFAGRQGLSEDEVQRILSGETPVTRTGLTHDTRRAEGFARRTAADQGTREAATDVPGRVFVYRRDDLPEIVQRRLSEVREGGRLTDVEQIADLGEDIVVKPEAAYIADDGIESLSRPLDDMTSYDAYEVFNELPWGKQIKKQSLMETNVADRIPGVPNRIAKDLSDKGVPIKDIEEFADVATLANTLKTSTVDNFTEQVPMPRPNQFDQTHMNLYGDAATKRGWHETETGFQVLSNGRTATAAVNFGLDGQLRISINPKLTAMDRDVARDQVLDLLNAHFKRGEFKGMFNQKGMA